MKAVKAVLATVTVWHVAGKVNLTKCNSTGKFVKNAIGQSEFDNVVIVAKMPQVTASVNWFSIVGCMFLALVVVFFGTLFSVAVMENQGSMFLLGAMTFAVLFISPLILMDAKMVSCEIA